MKASSILTEESALKIKARDVFGNRDYDKLWRAVYGEHIDNLISGKTITNEGAATETDNIFNNMHEDKQNATLENAGKLIPWLKKIFQKENTDTSGENQSGSTDVGGGAGYAPAPGVTPGVDAGGGSGVASGQISNEERSSIATNVTLTDKETCTVEFTDEKGNKNTVEYGVIGEKSTDEYKDRMAKSWGEKNGLAEGTLYNFDGTTYLWRGSGQNPFVLSTESSEWRSSNSSKEDIDKAWKNTQKTTANFEGLKGGFLSFIKNENINNDNENGTNVTITMDGKKYFVDITNPSDPHEAQLAGQKYNAGEVFRYFEKDGAASLWVSTGTSAYQIVERGGATFHKGDYGNLLAAVEKSSKTKDLTRGNAIFENHGALGIDRGFEKGDNFNVYVNGETYKVESGGAVSADDPVVSAAKDVVDGEVFSYGDQAYLKHNGKIYSIDTRFLQPNQENKLVEGIAGNKGNISKDTKTNIKDLNYLSTKTSFESGEKFNVSDVHGQNLKLKVVSMVANNSAVAEAATLLKAKTLFEFGGELYLKGSDGVYLLNSGFGDYEYVKSYSVNKGGDVLSGGITIPDEVLISSTPGIGGKYTNNYHVNESNLKEGGIIMFNVEGALINAKIEDITNNKNIANALNNTDIELLDDGYPLFVWNDRVYMLIGANKYALLNITDKEIVEKIGGSASEATE